MLKIYLIKRYIPCPSNNITIFTLNIFYIDITCISSDVKCIISDCGFTTVYEEMKYELLMSSYKDVFKAFKEKNI